MQTAPSAAAPLHHHAAAPRRRAASAAAFCLTLIVTVPAGHAATAFINEFHYDNAGSDRDEGVEIAASAGTDLGGWRVVLYNGSNGAAYGDASLSGLVPDQQNGFGTLFFAIDGIQNGPDGIALVAPDDAVATFLSYEGSFTATDGPAAGLTSFDIGVEEATDTPPGTSLQLIGVGAIAGDFAWAPSRAASPGAVNVGQTFVAAVPIPGALPMLGAATMLLAGIPRRRTGPGGVSAVPA
jgi:hypothetical protein